LGVALIGLVNLMVSFSLALMVALRARRVSFAQGGALLRLIGQRLADDPREFLFPPEEAPQRPAGLS
ncbi:MAG: site-specific recombinase, partial [Zoogloea sp.]|nr:site-specific recombinase [Zoogloea sp.]